MLTAFLTQYVVYPFFIIFARLAAMIMVLPGFSYSAVSARIRLLMTLAIALVLFPVVSPYVPPFPVNGMDVAVIVIMEVLLGTLLGLGVRILITAMSTAGDFISYLIGLQAATIFDPGAGSQTTAPAMFLTLLGMMVFFSVNLHHTMITALVESYVLFPPGLAPVDMQDVAYGLLKTTTHALDLGLRIAAPVVVAGFLVYVGFGLLNRLVPNIQVFFVTVPITLWLGIFILGISLGGMLSLYAEELAAYGLIFMQE